MIKYKLPVGFAVGTGRCGTMCLSRLLNEHKDMASFHEINPLNETFHRYSTWNGLQIDDAGFLYEKKAEVMSAHSEGDGFFEASAYLAFSVATLYQEFNSKFVLLVRHPEKVVNSYLRKGWYDTPTIIDDTTKIPGYQPSKQFHHFLGRTLPKDMKVEEWNGLSRVGKLSWYWATVNENILNSFSTLPAEATRVLRLEDLDYNRYTELAQFLGSDVMITEMQFNEITGARPNAFDNVPSSEQWLVNDRESFLKYASVLSEKFEYDLSHI